MITGNTFTATTVLQDTNAPVAYMILKIPKFYSNISGSSSRARS